VGCRVGIYLPLISRAGNNLAVPRNDRTDRNLPTLSGGLRGGQRIGHEAPIFI
jgi:hypothetical protein